MMTIKRISSFPFQLALSEAVKLEIEGREDAADYLVKISRVAWKFTLDGTPLFLVGAVRLSMLGSGHRVWMVPLAAFYDHVKAAYRFIRKAIRRLARYCAGISIVVNLENKAYLRFARHLGFSPSPHFVTEGPERYQWYWMR